LALLSDLTKPRPKGARYDAQGRVNGRAVRHDEALLRQHPDALKPSTKYSSKKELKFDKLDSGYMVATAGGDAVARGETLTLAHLSELAFWPKNQAKALLSGILDAIPNAKGSAVFIESTANGVSGEFYDFWKKPRRARTATFPFSSLGSFRKNTASRSPRDSNAPHLRRT
jgi:hypothetical protein